MNFEKLLNEKKIEKVEKRDFSTDSFEKDIELAKKIIETDNFNWAMTIAYESILKINNKLMNFLGYRAIGKEHHKNTFEFLRALKIDENLVSYLDNIRKKRNDFLYRDIENITKEEAEKIIEKAEELVQKIRTLVQKIRTEV